MLCLWVQKYCKYLYCASIYTTIFTPYLKTLTTTTNKIYFFLHYFFVPLYNMNWIEKITNTPLTITTGDGKIYTPIFNPNTIKKSVKFNTEAFDFVGMDGTYVSRENKSGTKFPLVFIFQGEDHLDVSKQFEESTKNKNPWSISHPFYDTILVQPTGLEFDNSTMNLTVISGTFYETITLSQPTSTVSAKNQVAILKSEADTLNTDIFNNNYTADISDVSGAKKGIDIVGKNFSNFGNATELQNLLRTSTFAATNLTSSPNDYITSVNSLINFPMSTDAAIELKLAQLLKLVESLSDIVSIDIFASQAGFIVTECCKNAINSEIANRTDVLFIIDQLKATYDYVLLKFDDNTDFEQDSDVAFKLDKILHVTIAELFVTAFNAKQERYYTLEQDNNIINLANKLGADLDEFLEWNEHTITEIISMKKGRKVKYYV